MQKLTELQQLFVDPFCEKIFTELSVFFMQHLGLEPDIESLMEQKYNGYEGVTEFSGRVDDLIALELQAFSANCTVQNVATRNYDNLLHLLCGLAWQQQPKSVYDDPLVIYAEFMMLRGQDEVKAFRSFSLSLVKALHVKNVLIPTIRLACAHHMSHTAEAGTLFRSGGIAATSLMRDALKLIEQEFLARSGITACFDEFLGVLNALTVDLPRDQIVAWTDRFLECVVTGPRLPLLAHIVQALNSALEASALFQSAGSQDNKEALFRVVCNGAIVLRWINPVITNKTQGLGVRDRIKRKAIVGVVSMIMSTVNGVPSKQKPDVRQLSEKWMPRLSDFYRGLLAPVELPRDVSDISLDLANVYEQIYTHRYGLLKRLIKRDLFPRLEAEWSANAGAFRVGQQLPCPTLSFCQCLALGGGVTLQQVRESAVQRQQQQQQQQLGLPSPLVVQQSTPMGLIASRSRRGGVSHRSSSSRRHGHSSSGRIARSGRSGRSSRRAPSGVSMDGVLMHGWIYKSHPKKMGRDKRYFVLRHDMLEWGKVGKSGAYQRANFVALSQVQLSSIVQSSRGFDFNAAGKSYRLLFDGDCTQNSEAWMSALQNAVKSCAAAGK